MFLNRYKSILCQEDCNLLELVRYIHLNPLRAKLVADLDQLDQYPFCGHGVIIGIHEQPWQDSKEVLLHFGKRVDFAGQKYREFVAGGMQESRREDLTGGDLIWSSLGWSAIKELKKSKIHMESDERILGDGDFVSEILAKSEEGFERRYAVKASGIDVDFVAKKVSTLLNMPEKDIWHEGKVNELVRPRSLLCFWAVRELGVTMARRLNISTVAVSKSVARGAEIAKKEGLDLT